MVLKKILGNNLECKADKLALTWEGPYKILELTSREAYKLENLEGKEEDLSWNIDHLKKYIANFLYVILII